MAAAVGAACRGIGFAVLPHDLIDGRVHSLALEEGRTQHGRLFPRLVLDALAPKRVVVEIDGARRPATRVP